LSTKPDEFLHHRLTKVARKVKKGKIRQKDKIIVRILTSSKEGVIELSARRPCSLPSSTLALFGEGARGLTAGGDVSRCCGGGEVSSAA
jgi:hypothetical protein